MRRYRLYTFEDQRLSYLGAISNVRNRKATPSLNQLATLQFEADWDNGLAEYLNDEAQLCVVVEEKQNPTNEAEWRVTFAGEVQFYTEVAETDQVPTCAYVATSAGHRLATRIADDGSGTGYAEGGLKVHSTDAVTLMRRLVAATNAHQGHCTIETSDTGSLSGVLFDTVNDEDDAEGLGGFKSIHNLLEEYSAAGAFEWRVEPTFRQDPGTPLLLGWLRVGAVIGVNRARNDEDAVVLRYGQLSGNNVRGLQLAGEKTILNRAWHVLGDATDSQPYAVQAKHARSISRFGLREDVADAPVIDTKLREEWVTTFVGVRAKPKRVISVTLQPESDPSVPVLHYDYEVGDILRLRATYGGEQAGRDMDLAVRITAVSVDIDDTGVETVSLELGAG